MFGVKWDPASFDQWVEVLCADNARRLFYRRRFRPSQRSDGDREEPKKDPVGTWFGPGFGQGAERPFSAQVSAGPSFEPRGSASVKRRTFFWRCAIETPAAQRRCSNRGKGCHVPKCPRMSHFGREFVNQMSKSG